MSNPAPLPTGELPYELEGMQLGDQIIVNYARPDDVEQMPAVGHYSQIVFVPRVLDEVGQELVYNMLDAICQVIDHVEAARRNGTVGPIARPPR